MTEKINPETYFFFKIYTFEYYVKFSFWVSVVMWFKYFSHIWASNDQVCLHNRTVSREPLQITLKRRDVDEGLGQFL